MALIALPDAMSCDKPNTQPVQSFVKGIKACMLPFQMLYYSPLKNNVIETRHEISNNVVCVTSKASDQPANTRSLIRAFASCLNII